MPIIGYSPWVDAANFGQGVGQSLSQGLLQLPMQRHQMALQQAQMMNMQRLGLARLAATQQLRDAQVQAAQARIAASQAQLAHYQQQPQQNVNLKQQIEPRFDKDSGQYQGYFDYQNKNWVPSPAQTGGVGQGGNTGLPTQQVKPMQPFQQDEQALKWAQMYGSGMRDFGGGTNAMQQQFMNMISNRLYGPQGGMSQQATNGPTTSTNRVFNYNPNTGLLE